MNSEKRKQRMEACIQLAQEWKLSGMTQAKFASSKGMSLEAVKYRIRKVRECAPDMLFGSALCQTEFASVPQEFVNSSDPTCDNPMADQPVLMVQTGGACLRVTNQIDPYLLKTALEVMLTC